MADSGLAKSQQPNDAKQVSSVSRIPGTGRIVGEVFDSLRARPLQGADVLVEGKIVVAGQVDSAGRFSFDRVPAGNYRLTVSHPWLDTVGLSLITPDFHVAADSVSILRMSVPSASTVIGIKCKAHLGANGASAVIGHIASAQSLKPIPKADVQISWTTYEVSKENGVKQAQRIQSDTTGAHGAYALCGLPNGLDAKVVAQLAGGTRSEARIVIPDSGISVVVRDLLLAAGPGEEADRRTRITGRLVTPSGQPPTPSVMQVLGTSITAVTDSAGGFALEQVPMGTRTILVHHLGQAEQVITIDVTPSMSAGLVIRLEKSVAVLTAVVVTAQERDRTLDRVGFSRRSQHSVGHYLTGEQIARMSDFKFTDLLRGIPGINVGIDKYGEDVVVSHRAGGSPLNPTYGCVQYFVDGMPWGNGALEAMRVPGADDSPANKTLARIAIEAARQLNAVLQKGEILGIEVYQGGGAPAYFNQGGHNCATIAVWTKASVFK
jgi:hypothetical protein